MKLKLLLTTLLLTTVALFAGNQPPSDITVTCSGGGGTSADGSITCAAGQVSFSGTGFGHHAHVTVTSDNGAVLDDSNLQPPDGNLSFSEDMSFAGVYTVEVS